eukprot:10171205-Karenia_brevis.AAC.1
MSTSSSWFSADAVRSNSFSPISQQVNPPPTRMSFNMASAWLRVNRAAASRGAAQMSLTRAKRHMISMSWARFSREMYDIKGSAPAAGSAPRRPLVLDGASTMSVAQFSFRGFNPSTVTRTFEDWPHASFAQNSWTGNLTCSFQSSVHKSPTLGERAQALQASSARKEFRPLGVFVGGVGVLLLEYKVGQDSMQMLGCGVGSCKRVSARFIVYCSSGFRYSPSHCTLLAASYLGRLWTTCTTEDVEHMHPRGWCG